MAEVFKTVHGEKLGRFMAGHVQRGIFAEADEVLGKAEANLNQVRANPRYTGDLHVQLYMRRGKGRDGKLDYYIVLDDDGTIPGAAWSIEYGHYAGKDDGRHRNWVEGKWIIHDAAGLQRRAR